MRASAAHRMRTRCSRPRENDGLRYCAPTAVQLEANLANRRLICPLAVLFALTGHLAVIPRTPHRRHSRPTRLPFIPFEATTVTRCPRHCTTTLRLIPIATTMTTLTTATSSPLLYDLTIGFHPGAASRRVAVTLCARRRADPYGAPRVPSALMRRASSRVRSRGTIATVSSDCGYQCTLPRGRGSGRVFTASGRLSRLTARPHTSPGQGRVAQDPAFRPGRAVSITIKLVLDILRARAGGFCLATCPPVFARSGRADSNWGSTPEITCLVPNPGSSVLSVSCVVSHHVHEPGSSIEHGFWVRTPRGTGVPQ